MATIGYWKDGRRWFTAALILLSISLVSLFASPGLVAHSTPFAGEESDSALTNYDESLLEALDSGWSESCGLRSDGQIVCWGDDPGGKDYHHSGPFTQVTAGGRVGCGLRPNGSVDCWGDNSEGAAEDHIGPFTLVDTGGRHTCGLSPDGSVECWGANWLGQAEGRDGPFTSISLGVDQTCGLKPDGSVDCWGTYGQDRDGPFTQISAGYTHVCGLRPNGSVHCWGGSNDYGQADDQGGPFTQVDAGIAHTCGLKPDGSVFCWGDNDLGESEEQPGPFSLVRANSNHSCGLKPDGSVYCWGIEMNSHGGPFAPYIPASGHMIRASLSSEGVQGNGWSWQSEISADGRYIAFESLSDNLVDGDSNGFTDIFVHDSLAGETTRVSVDSAGAQANKPAWTPAISWYGRFVAFESKASNLVPDDTNDVSDIFLHDRQTGQTMRVSVDSGGKQSNNNSRNPAIAEEGRSIVFESDASNLAPGDNNGQTDIFFHDQLTGETALVSVNSAGQIGNDASRNAAVSADGRFVAFQSAASNLVAGDTNRLTDIFVHDRQTGQTSRVSVDSAGNQATGNVSKFAAISYDGRYIAFQSFADNLVPDDINENWDIFVHDRQTGETTRVSVDSAGNQMFAIGTHESKPAISKDGRYVAFNSNASNLVPDDTNEVDDVFVHDRQTGQTTLVSNNSAAQQGNDESLTPALSHDGRFVTFASRANNLVRWDTNERSDIFIHDQEAAGGRIAFTIQEYSPTDHYTGITLADMDGDGQPEVLIGNRTAKQLEIWRYDSDLDLLSLVDAISLTNDLHDLQAADFDGDGDVDIALGLRFDGLHLATNTAQGKAYGSWQVKQIDAQYSLQVLADDFDSDGNLDLFHGTDYGPINTFYGDGKGGFTQGASVADPDTDMRFPLGFNAAQLNNQGGPDLIGVDGAFLRAFLYPGNRTESWFSVGPKTPLGDYPCCPVNWLMSSMSPSAADLDDNGSIEQVATLQTRPNGPVDLLLFRGNPPRSNLKWTPEPLETIKNVGGAGHAGTADLDGDGYTDIHYGGAEFFYGLRVYLNDSGGGFLSQNISLDHGLGGMNSFAAGDINNDGGVDIVASRYTKRTGFSSGFEVLFGREKRTVMLPLILAH